MHAVEGVVTYGPDDLRVRGGVISFNVGEVHAHDVASVLNEFGVCVRSGHHCAQPLMERRDVAATSHMSQFDVRTGEPISPPASDALATYVVAVEGETVFVDLPD